MNNCVSSSLLVYNDYNYVILLRLVKHKRRQHQTNVPPTWAIFYGHDNVPVRCRAHLLMKHNHGYLRSNWTPPSGDYLPCIALVDDMVIDFCAKTRVVALWNCFSKLALKKAQHGSATQLVEAMTSCVERSNAMVNVDSSYQTLTTDNNHWSYQPPKTLVEKWVLMSAHSC